MNFYRMDTSEIVAYINGKAEWDDEQFKALDELADRAGIDPDDYRDDDGFWDRTHDFVVAIQDALHVDLGE